MQFVSIASGSSGNCIFVGSDTTSILVDAGISNKRIEQGLNEIGRKGSELDGIMITHEHSDHVKGLGVLARKQGVPIYGTKETMRSQRSNPWVNFHGNCFIPFSQMRIFQWAIWRSDPLRLTMMRLTRWHTVSRMTMLP